MPQGSAESPSGVGEQCQNSAAAHLFSSAENQSRLFREMSLAIKDRVGLDTWRDYSVSSTAPGKHSKSPLTITAGTGPDRPGSASLNERQQYLQGQLVVTPVGARSCDSWGLSCQEADRDNQMHYRVHYYGDASTRGVNELELSFTLLMDISAIEGWSVLDQLGLGARNITADPDTCLAQLIDSVEPGDVNFVAEGPIQKSHFGDSNLEFCAQTKTVKSCPGSASGPQATCYDVTFTVQAACK